MDLNALLGQALGPSTINQLSQVIGESPKTTATAVQAAVPAMLGALAGNAQQAGGAASLLSALDRDHDGSILDDLGGLLGQGAGAASVLAGQGGGILGHVFGNRQSTVAKGVSQASGMDLSKVTQLLAMLAPIVMGALGKAKQQSGGAGFDAGGLGSLLGGAAQSMGGGGGLLGGLGSLLDANKDGSPLDDVAGMLGGLLGGGKR